MLDSYIELGDVLVAETDADGIVAELQLIELDADHGEVQSLCVAPELQRAGVGRVLIEEAVAESRRRGWTELHVRTATADTGNIRFYQRVGFRCLTIERDAFTEVHGYPPGLEFDGIPLRDAISFSLTLSG